LVTSSCLRPRHTRTATTIATRSLTPIFTLLTWSSPISSTPTMSTPVTSAVRIPCQAPAGTVRLRIEATTPPSTIAQPMRCRTSRTPRTIYMTETLPLPDSLSRITRAVVRGRDPPSRDPARVVERVQAVGDRARRRAGWQGERRGERQRIARPREVLVPHRLREREVAHQWREPLLVRLRRGVEGRQPVAGVVVDERAEPVPAARDRGGRGRRRQVGAQRGRAQEAHDEGRVVGHRPR